MHQDFSFNTVVHDTYIKFKKHEPLNIKHVGINVGI